MQGEPMSSRTVKSAIGTDIEIVADTDWALTAGVSPKALTNWHGSKPLVIRELWEHGPAIDANGGATAVLYERMQKHYPNTFHKLPERSAITPLLSDEGNAPAFERNVKGKRCYSIELVAMPDVWYRKLIGDLGIRMPTFAATPVALNGTKPEPIEATEPPPVVQLDEFVSTDTETLSIDIPDVSGPSIEVEIAGQVAMELLTRVVEIISAGDSHGVTDVKLRQLQTEYETVAGRLAQRLEENDRMRRQLRETGEELAAVKLERDGLRQRLRQTEANLTSALKGESAHAVTTEVMKRVDRIMRETPRPNPREET